MHEVQERSRDEERQGSHHEERDEGSEGRMPCLRHQGLQDPRQGVSLSRFIILFLSFFERFHSLYAYLFIMEKCDECGKGALVKKKVDYVLLGKNLGTFDAFVCDQCGDTIFEGETMLVIEQKAKTAGIWGIAAKTRIGTSGNALDVKLPKALVGFLKLKKGQEVIIEPVDETRFQVGIG